MITFITSVSKLSHSSVVDKAICFKPVIFRYSNNLLIFILFYAASILFCLHVYILLVRIIYIRMYDDGAVDV